MISIGTTKGRSGAGTPAGTRLGKMGRFFGRREALALTDYVHLDERVVELAQGVYDKHQGMLVLTTRRLFFFDRPS